jgi:predicted  nucleic acid-binding Zn-ribbon protein
LSAAGITGLEYKVIEDSAVSAMLEVKLAPQIARQFGKVATADVSQVNGKLLRTDFFGEDVAPAATTAAGQQSSVSQRIADVEKQLARATSGEERAQLQQQLSQLRVQLAEFRAEIAGAAERLAGTPMTFN